MAGHQQVHQGSRSCATPRPEGETHDGKTAIVALYVLTMVAVVVGVDVLFFRHHLWPRLMVNIGIALVFGAFYLRFLKHP
jgi:uncharacterized protein (DUF983 family)